MHRSTCPSARSRRPLALAGGLALALLVSACGSTVAGQAQGQSAVQGASGGELGVPTGESQDGGTSVLGTGDGTLDSGPGTGDRFAPGSATSNSSTGGSAGGSSAGGGTAGSTAGAGSGTATRSSGAGGPVRLGKGVTATTVKIGMIYSPNLNDAQESTGQDNLKTGDAKAQQKALVDEINRTGGLAGRKVVLDAYPISATTPDAEQAFNAACEHFVQDAKVFAVMTAGPESFGVCLEKGGVLHIGSDLTAATSQSTALRPHGLRPAGITMEDSARLLVQGLAEQAYFKDSVVGVITFDSKPHKDAVDKVMLPALKRIGHPAKERAYIQAPKGLSDYGSMSSSISAAVLQFRSANVTHVIIFDQQGRITTFFTPAAENQGYRPRYGFTSQAGFQVGLKGGGVSREQAEDAAGIGWLPAFDVPVDRSKLSPGAKRCDDFFNRKGMPATGENAMVIQQFQCQDTWLLDNVMDRLTSAVTREAFISLAEATGSFLTAANIGIGFDARNHDGVRLIRNVGWDEPCGCFRYVGGDRKVR